jgi:hypothetical protein
MNDNDNIEIYDDIDIIPDCQDTVNNSDITVNTFARHGNRPNNCYKRKKDKQKKNT